MTFTFQFVVGLKVLREGERAFWWPKWGRNPNGGFYVALMKMLVLPNSSQAEIASDYSDQYLATSRGMSWVHVGDGRFTRKATSELADVSREDM